MSILQKMRLSSAHPPPFKPTIQNHIVNAARQFANQTTPRASSLKLSKSYFTGNPGVTRITRCRVLNLLVRKFKSNGLSSGS